MKLKIIVAAMLLFSLAVPVMGFYEPKIGIIGMNVEEKRDDKIIYVYVQNVDENITLTFDLKIITPVGSEIKFEGLVNPHAISRIGLIAYQGQFTLIGNYTIYGDGKESRYEVSEKVVIKKSPKDLCDEWIWLAVFLFIVLVAIVLIAIKRRSES